MASNDDEEDTPFLTATDATVYRLAKSEFLKELNRIVRAASRLITPGAYDVQLPGEPGINMARTGASRLVDASSEPIHRATLVVNPGMQIAYECQPKEVPQRMPSRAPIAIAIAVLLGSVFCACMLLVNRDTQRPFTQERMIQRGALVKLYFATNGENWFASDGWLDHNGSECEWKFVTCDPETSHVTHLDFTKQGLNGSIPTEIALLTHLVSLKLARIALTGTIPSELGLLSHLEKLDLTANVLLDSKDRNTTDVKTLSGTLPSELGRLTRLGALSFGYNYHLKGTIPTEYGALTNLIGLYFFDTSIVGSIPSELGLLTDLVWLRMESSRLTGTIPSEMGMLTNLQHLILDGELEGGLTGSIPSELGSLTQLLRLNLGWNSLTGKLPEKIWSLTLLNALSIGNNRLSGSISSYIGNLAALEYMSLGRNNLTSRLPSELGRLASLKQFWCQENAFTGPVPSEVGLLASEVLVTHTNRFTGGPVELGEHVRRYVRTGLQPVGGKCRNQVSNELHCTAYFPENSWDPCQCNCGLPEDASTMYLEKEA
jgi:hypothetical protein